MAELKERELKILSALSQLADPARPTEIGKLVGEIPLDTGRALAELSKGELTVQTDKGQNLWALTDTGRKYLEEHKQLAETVTETVTETVPLSKKTPEPPPEGETVPSQADLFKAEGQLIGFGTRKGDIKLDAVVNYVERVADLDDLDSIWNALTEMRVANDIKKTWIRLYKQNLPGKEMSSELKAKLETGTEAEKVSIDKEPPRAKRFNVFEGQILPDPEGEYTFSMALQKAMVEKGASSNQAAEMATTFAKMNTDTMNLLIPLLTKAPEGDSITKLMMNLLTPLLTKAPEGDSITKLILAQMETLQKEMREGQKSSPEIQALTQQLDQLRDTLHNEQLARIQEQNQASFKELTGFISSLQQQIKAVAEGKQAESKIGLMSKALDAGAEQLSGIRQDIKPLVQSLAEGRVAPGEKTPAQKAGFGTGLDKGIERAHEATELENELFFGKGA